MHNVGGIGRYNKDGVDYYHRLIDYMLAHSMLISTFLEVLAMEISFLHISDLDARN